MILDAVNRMAGVVSSTSLVTLRLDRRAGGQIAGRTRSRQGPRHLVRVDERERRRPLAQELVEEGGLPGAVGAGEEDEGGGHRIKLC